MIPQIVQINHIHSLIENQHRPGVSPLDSESFKNHVPDVHLLLEDGHDVLARCSLWWKHTPTDLNQKTGLIGHYAAIDNESAQRIIHYGCDELAKQGCGIAIAPMNGSTWQSYRFVVERGEEPSFFLEVDRAEQDLQPFQDNGFSPLSYYRSALTEDLLRIEPRLTQVEARIKDLGIRIRSLNIEDFESELRRIYQLSIHSFKHNFLYTPIAWEQFSTQYAQVKPYIQPELVLIAEDGNQLVGFLFAVPDVLQAKRGAAIDTVIIKTVAVLPGRAYAGLGNLLLMRGQAIAHGLGYRRAIHALMHDGNKSRNISSRYARTIRRYALFSKSLKGD
jgi:L-amino acid N-acyltransferase YncA